MIGKFFPKNQQLENAMTFNLSVLEHLKIFHASYCVSGAAIKNVKFQMEQLNLQSQKP